MSGDDGDDDDPGDFRSAMKGVKPIDRDRLRPEPPPRVRRRPAGAADPGEPVVFEIERIDERVEGLAPGADRRTLARLASGDPEPEADIDLHGLDATGAERELRRALLRAHDEGMRCVLVIHGRGRHSDGPPVLREAFSDWLAAPPLGPRVLAFASAAPRHGGVGASYVLLRSRPAAPRPKR